MAASRLRKVFRYPSESDSDEPPEGIDEEEQDKVISKLNTWDAAQNALYTKAFLALALLPLPWYLNTLFGSSNGQDVLIALLGVTSLISTGYIIYFMPPRKPDPKGKRPVYVVEKEEASGPMRKYLVWITAALCGILAVNGVQIARKLGDDRAETTDPRIWRCLLPSGISYSRLVCKAY
ncbi:MAG: hypothetical protein M1821_006250 [Bathelium mastoideum]|nr:MAG: hypothetical protein M1821_006250 [Bathelium mastoideum]KAI9686590.1 MAG: hypothetical protein M1822_003601 [Bathelium mastoideum]